MEVDERKRDSWWPTDVVFNEIDVEAALSVLGSVVAAACMYAVSNEHNHFYFWTNQPFQSKTFPFYLHVLRCVQCCSNIAHEQK